MNASQIEVYKSLYRNKIRKEVRSIPPAVRRRKIRSIQRRLWSFVRQNKYKRLFIFVSKDWEVDTLNLIRRFIRSGIEVYLPRLGKARVLSAVRIQNVKRDLRKGPFGILEPISRRGKRANINDFGVLFVPGVAFDPRGVRLGRGGGYFDRFLAGRRISTKAIGISFSEQTQERLPKDVHDKLLDGYITDKETKIIS
ncbi:MAG: 5-formyltetrahydrofolate cyclo-ligase [Candidatus Omnitrophica bacterium]|nr:5-formyltetrahydrofolate cyclo-ligase [Candidatus Omnitrophota bacterium]